jgi:MoxR-like ATPase
MKEFDKPTRLLARSYAQRLDEIKQHFVSRDEVIDLLGIGALCREHVLVIGPPGTAKTQLLNRFAKALDTSPFTYLLTRFTEPAEIFGPIDVDLFRSKSVYQINVTGMLPEARIAFLDEVFQGSSAILNTMLTLINERTFHNGLTNMTTPLIMLVGSSNDMPDDPVLAAFSDRFLLRCTLGYVGDDQLDDVLHLGWSAELDLIRSLPVNGNGKAPSLPSAEDQAFAAVSDSDLRQLQQAIARVDLSPVLQPYGQIIQALRAEGVTMSDRRAVKAQKVFAASALLSGRGQAELSDLARLVNLWADPRDELSLRRIVADHGVPVAEPGTRTRELNEILGVYLHDITVRRGQVSTEQDFRELLRRGARLASELRRDHPGERAALEQVQREQQNTITLFRERFPAKGMD